MHTLFRKEATLHIAGVDSVMLEKHQLDLVMEKLPEDGPAISHEPDFADISSTTGRFSLQISGHSHGGQFLIPGLALSKRSSLYQIPGRQVSGERYGSIHQSWSGYQRVLAKHQLSS